MGDTAKGRWDDGRFKARSALASSDFLCLDFLYYGEPVDSFPP
jgi:hypothetical protein